MLSAKHREESAMTIEAQVGEDGMLVTKVPDRFKGKKVRISIREIEEAPRSQWEQIREILQAADQLDIPRRRHEEIIQEIHSFRESE
jgi:hypothetical protein